MRSTHLARRLAATMLLAAFVASTLVGAAGCWFTTGKEGFFCEADSDCKDGLRCRTYVYKNQPRKQCRPAGKKVIVARSGYNTLFVVMTYVWWAVFPVGLVGTVLGIRRVRRNVLAEQKAGQRESDPEQSSLSNSHDS